MDLAKLRELFAYTEWANARLLDGVEKLTGDQFEQPLSGSFSSIRDTFAHIVAAEWVWLRRWKGVSPSAMPDWAIAPSAAALRTKLVEVQEERAAFLAALTANDLEQSISYTNLAGEKWAYPLGELLFHLVNHSTYHRGQVATMLRQVGATPLPTDYLVFKDEFHV